MKLQKLLHPLLAATHLLGLQIAFAEAPAQLNPFAANSGIQATDEVYVPARPGEIPNTPILDQDGRQIIVGGFVTLEKVPYTPEDYQRMVRMGANFQVIRMPVGMIGAWPGTEADQAVLQQFDDFVRMGKDAGLKTIFKMVFYGIQPAHEEKKWEMIWSDTHATQQKLIDGWTRIGLRYKDEPAVFGYDLLNEPARGISRDYQRLQAEQVLPLQRRMADALHAISPEKWALFQPLIRKPEDQPTRHRDPVVPIVESFNRDRVIYAPHLYQMDTSVIAMQLDNLQRQAALSNAPLMLGEWGSPTLNNTDGNAKQEARFTNVYEFTVTAIDSRGIGGIKPWFCGERRPIPLRDGKWMTWAIFSDKSPAGKVERKYITDVIVRTRPLVIAGRLKTFVNDFETNSFEMTLYTDPALGATEIFVPTERHYPNGFRLEIGSNLVLKKPAGSDQFVGMNVATQVARDQAKHIRWNDAAQRLVIERWIGDARELTMKVRPNR